jgi:hypothetical protein
VEIEDGAQARLECDPDPGGVPPGFTIVSSMNMERTLLRSTSNDPRTGEYLYLCTHFQIEVWLLLIAALSALEARLKERPEKYKYLA